MGDLLNIMIIENNIFDDNINELMHDSILSWLIRGFNCSDESSIYYRTSVKFLKLLNIDTGEFTNVEVFPQYKIEFQEEKDKNKLSYGFVDILAIFSHKDKPNKEILIIEDKIFSEEHNNQFENYKNGLSMIKNLDEKSYKLVYIKLGKITNASINRVKKLGWEVIKGDEILSILIDEFDNSSYEGRVLEFYYAFLSNLKIKYDSYHKILSQWTIFSIFGFYEYLSKKYKDSDFLYSGRGDSGSCIFWTKIKQIEISKNHFYNLYFQLELFAPLKQKIKLNQFEDYTPQEDKSRIDKWRYSIKLEEFINEKINGNLVKTNRIEEISRIINEEVSKMGYKIDNRNKREDAFIWHRKIEDLNNDTFEKEIQDQIDFLVKLVWRKIDPYLGGITEVE